MARTWAETKNFEICKQMDRVVRFEDTCDDHGIQVLLRILWFILRAVERTLLKIHEVENTVIIGWRS